MAAEDDTDSNSESGADLGSAAGNGPPGGGDDQDQPEQFAGDDHQDATDRGSTDRDSTDRDIDDGAESGAENLDDAPAGGDGGEDGDDGFENDGSENDGSEGDEPELVGVGARGAGSASTGGDKSDRSEQSTADKAGTKRARRKKERPTPRRSAGGEQAKRTTPVGFVRGSVGELRKVVYPTRQQLGNYFVVVLVFVALVIAIVSALDYGFGLGIVKVFT